MTQEQNTLLLKDLCARVPYGVKVRSKIPINQNEHKEIVGQVTSVHYNISIVQVEGFDVIADYSPHFEIKPYLFPISSITEEQWKEITDIQIKESLMSIDSNNDYMSNPLFSIGDLKTLDWCYVNHIDYRGLIPMGLAIDATDLNIY